MLLKKSLAIVLTVMLSLYVMAGAAVAADEEIERLVLSKNELALEMGNSQSLTATAIYVNGKTEDVTVKTDWTSSSSSIASVYAGTITAKDVGTATLTATYKTKTVVVNVKVTKKVKALTKDKHTINIRTGMSEQVELSAVYQDGTIEDVTKKADWTIDNYAVATVTNGLVKGEVSGTAIITAKFGNQTATIPVSIEIVKRLDPSKAEVSLLLKGKEKIELMATFPDGTVEDVADKAEWSTDKETVADALKGVITGYGAGQATITAKYGTKTATIKVDVDSTKKLEINKQDVFLRVNGTEQLQLKAVYLNGTTDDITSKAEWSSSDTEIADVNKGSVIAHKSGEAVITAKYADKVIKINIDVEVPRRLDVNKEFISLQVAGTEQLKVIATYANGTKDEELASKAEWTSSNPAIADVIKGKITAYKSGEATIKASYGGKTLTILVDVDIPRIITLSKTSVALQIGDTQQLTLKAIYVDGREENVTEQAEWLSASGAIAEVRRGLITGVSTGATSITAKFGTRSTVIPVSIGVIKSMTADQKKLILEKGGSSKIVVTVVYTDGTVKDVTSLAAWTVGDPAVAEVDAGVVNAIGNGKTNITVSFENKTISVPIEVGIAQTLSANPKVLILEKNEIRQVVLTATDSNGVAKNVTNDAEWSSSAPLIADVSAGMVTALANGKATITAKYGGKTITIVVEIEIVEKVVASVRYLSLKSGSKSQIRLQATLSDGKTKDVTDLADWKTSAYKTADVELGLVTGIAYGKTTVTAKYAGKTVSIPVEVDQLKYLKTSEVQIDLVKGETKQVTAIATYTDGSDANVSIPAIWKSSKNLVADVKDGIIKATGKGKATITVSFGGMNTKIVVNVK
ncbi:Ig-like domain-containing protein [Paenibacillus eucommiae]|uniref:BIG2 domain-containing protein n=1 Tax=Paenibacillus eucommiae TaxID=1355755 RepID=A0ABS4J523_9BACL|nr:Ig-like domain-containing protein [Paenibacillus eucommiae]MBP1994947.1 hypothetical protein [Paenibacillus eucommiae]